VQFTKVFFVSIVVVALASSGTPASAAEAGQNTQTPSAAFGDNIDFLRQYTDVVVLSDRHGASKVALAPAWQGRVMTSTAQGTGGRSFGWINRKLIASRKPTPHINALGGEDRLWLGPEGGQFSLYFAKGVPFDLAHWYVPAALDTLPFEIVQKSTESITFKSEFTLTNYSGTSFRVGIQREIRVLEPDGVWQYLHTSPLTDLQLVAYESHNRLTNVGTNPWVKKNGLLSIWILGMFNPSPATTIFVPIKPGPESSLGDKATSNYFGGVPPDRLKVSDDAVFLRADGQFRSKIGVSPRRSLGLLGSYDADHHVLTIVQSNQPQGVTDYVNSLWHLQDDPYSGDALNAYNDGPPTPGAAQLGPFFELETSSPAAALLPSESIEHTHRTIHLTGPEAQLDVVARQALGVPLATLQGAFSTTSRAQLQAHPAR